MRLQDKVALITGGANGIGLATAERFAKEGAKIILWDVSDKGNEVCERLTKEGYDVIFKKVSVTDQEEVQKAVAEAHQHFGRIDILINNAALRREKRFDDISFEEWREVMDVILNGAFPHFSTGPTGNDNRLSS